jgi:hypothetical protein
LELRQLALIPAFETAEDSAFASNTVSIDYARTAMARRFDSKARTEVRFLLSRLCLREHQLTTEDVMKLVRFDDRKTGLLVQLPTGLHVIDIVASLGALIPEDPLSNGVLNGILKDRGSWAPLIAHWEQVRFGLRRLALLAATNSDNSSLVIHRLDEVRVGSHSVRPTDIATLEILEQSEVAYDPTGREAMLRQIALPPPRADGCPDSRVIGLDAHRTLKSGASANARRR